MKRFLIVLMILLFPALSWARCGELCKRDPIQLAFSAGVQAVVSSGGAAACNYTSCSAGCKLFDWDCSTASMASNVCSLGDTSATVEGAEADLTTNVGYVTLFDTSKDGNDNYKLGISSYDIFPAGDLTLEITINFSVITASAEIFSVWFSSNDYFIINFATGNDIRVQHRGAGATATSKTFDVNLSTSTSYSIILKAGVTNGMAISINGGSSYITDATATITPMTDDGSDADAFTVGNDTTYNLEGTITNIRISAGWRADI